MSAALAPRNFRDQVGLNDVSLVEADWISAGVFDDGLAVAGAWAGFGFAGAFAGRVEGRSSDSAETGATTGVGTGASWAVAASGSTTSFISACEGCSTFSVASSSLGATAVLIDAGGSARVAL